MTDTIYLICTKKGVQSMVKTSRGVQNLRKGEVPIKLKVNVDDGNWKPPFIEKEIVVDRWDDNLELDDIDFEGQYVTEDEVDLIRQHRLDRMNEILSQQGYTVTKNEEE